MAFFWDFPVAPEGSADARIVRSYITGGYMLPDAGNKSANGHDTDKPAAVHH